MSRQFGSDRPEMEISGASAVLVLPDLPIETTASRLKSIGLTVLVGLVLAGAAYGYYLLQNSIDADHGNASTAMPPVVPPVTAPQPTVDTATTSPLPARLGTEPITPAQIVPPRMASSSPRSMERKVAELKPAKTKVSPKPPLDDKPQQSAVVPQPAAGNEQPAAEPLRPAPASPAQPERREPAPKPAEASVDWRTALRTDLDACQKRGIFERVLCVEKARWKHCEPNRWNTVLECVVAKSESPNR